LFEASLKNYDYARKSKTFLVVLQEIFMDYNCFDMCISLVMKPKNWIEKSPVCCRGKAIWVAWIYSTRLKAEWSSLKSKCFWTVFWTHWRIGDMRRCH